MAVLGVTAVRGKEEEEEGKGEEEGGGALMRGRHAC